MIPLQARQIAYDYGQLRVLHAVLKDRGRLDVHDGATLERAASAIKYLLDGMIPDTDWYLDDTEEDEWLVVLGDERVNLTDPRPIR